MKKERERGIVSSNEIERRENGIEMGRMGRKRERERVRLKVTK